MRPGLNVYDYTAGCDDCGWTTRGTFTAPSHADAETECERLKAELEAQHNRACPVAFQSRAIELLEEILARLKARP